jgi:hypothetical protein
MMRVPFFDHLSMVSLERMKHATTPRVFYDGNISLYFAAADVDRIDLSQPGDAPPITPGPDPSL